MKTVQIAKCAVMAAWVMGLSLQAATRVAVENGIATLDVSTELSPYTMTAEDAAAVLAGGVIEFRKTGAGTLVADAANASIATFSGTIRIQNGIYRVTAPGDCGVDGTSIYVETSAASSGQLYVDNGASAFDSGNRKFYISGTGLDNKGAIFFNNVSATAKMSYLALTGDASVWFSEKGLTLDGTIDLQYHTLDIEPVKGYCAVGGSATVKNGGHIIFDQNRRQTSSGLNWGFTYEASAGATLTAGGFVNLVPEAAKTPWPWTVHQALNFRQNISENQGFSVVESSIVSPSYGMYGGQVTLNANVTHGNDSAGRWQIAGFKGPISGSGNISMVNESKHNRTWFKLGSANPDWTGTISVKRAYEINTNGANTAEHANGLALFADGALTQKTLELRNAELYLGGGDPVQHLPDIRVADSGRFWGTVTGEVGTVVKTGASALTFANRLVVTNELIVSNGTLSIDFATALTAVTSRYTYAEMGLAGLSEVMYIGDAATVTNGPKIRAIGPIAGFYDGNNNKCLNSIDNKYSAPGYDVRSSVWHQGQDNNTRYQYDGYIWNHNATNETWGFMSCVNSASEIWMEDENGALAKIQTGKYYYTTGEVVKAYVEHVMKPGANRIRLFVKGNQGGSAGANIASAIGESGDVRAWAKPKAFCYDRTGSNLLKQGIWTKTAYEGFTTLLDMGEKGDLLTTVPYTQSELVEQHLEEVRLEIAKRLPTFRRLRFVAGTVFDLGENAGYDLFAVNDVIGSPRIVGDLRVKGAWTLDHAELKANGPVEVEGRLDFAAGSSIVVEDLEKVSSGEEIALFHAAGGISGTLPETVSFTHHPARSASAQVHLNDDGKTLSLRVSSGMLILFK